MAEPATFPILYNWREPQAWRTVLPHVPWAFVAPYAAQAQANHQQTLAELTARGGLGLSELLAVVEQRRYVPMPEARALQVLQALLAQDGAGDAGR